MIEIIEKLITWFDAPKVIGFFFAFGTFSYLLFVTTKHHEEFWEGIKGDNGKLEFIEAALTVWLVLFVVMIIADFSFGLVASPHAWWSMDSVFLIGVGGKVTSVMNRGKKNETTSDSGQ